MRFLFAFALLAAPALAQDPTEMQTQLAACAEGLDVEAISVRAESWAEAEGFDARVTSLCEAGDGEGAVAFAEQSQASFYSQDAEAEQLGTCVAKVLGQEALTPTDVCGE